MILKLGQSAPAVRWTVTASAGIRTHDVDRPILQYVFCHTDCSEIWLTVVGGTSISPGGRRHDQTCHPKRTPSWDIPASIYVTVFPVCLYCWIPPMLSYRGVCVCLHPSNWTIPCRLLLLVNPLYAVYLCEAIYGGWSVTGPHFTRVYLHSIAVSHFCILQPRTISFSFYFFSLPPLGGFELASSRRKHLILPSLPLNRPLLLTPRSMDLC